MRFSTLPELQPFAAGSLVSDFCDLSHAVTMPAVIAAIRAARIMFFSYKNLLSVLFVVFFAVQFPAYSFASDAVFLVLVDDTVYASFFHVFAVMHVHRFHFPVFRRKDSDAYKSYAYSNY